MSLLQSLCELSLKYTAPSAVLYAIEIDRTCRVLVVGDPKNAAYEWCIEHHREIESHSNDGFGSPEAALREGLNAYYGAGSATHDPSATLSLKLVADSGFESESEGHRITLGQWAEINRILNQMGKAPMASPDGGTHG